MRKREKEKAENHKDISLQDPIPIAGYFFFNLTHVHTQKLLSLAPHCTTVTVRNEVFGLKCSTDGAKIRPRTLTLSHVLLFTLLQYDL